MDYMWFVSPKAIIEISIFLLIFADLISCYVFNNGYINKNRNITKKIIVFYILAWLCLSWFEFSIQQLNQVIHVVIILVFASLSLLTISLIRPKTDNREKLFSKEITPKTYFIIRITFSLFIFLLSIIGWGTERLKDFSFTGGYNVVISLDSAYTEQEITKLLENSFDYDVLRVILLTSANEQKSVQITYNSTLEIADSIRNNKLYNSLKPVIGNNTIDNFIRHEMKFGSLCNPNIFHNFSITLLILIICLTVFYSFYFKNIFNGFKIALLLNFLLTVLVGVLLFTQKILPDYVVDEKLFQTLILFIVLYVYKSYIYISRASLIDLDFNRHLKSDLLFFIAILIISIPLWFLYRQQEIGRAHV